MGKNKPSRRQKLKIKYKIQKKVKEHRRKMNKLARKNPHLFRKKNPKWSIPSQYPYKHQIMKDAKKEKKIMEEEKENLRKRKEEARAMKKAMSQQVEDMEESSEEEEENNVEKDDVEEDEDYPIDNVLVNCTPIDKKLHYIKMKRVFKYSDIILQVLDARDPISCRSPMLEKKIFSERDKNGNPKKKLVLVLNKIDLIPASIVKKWISYFNQEYPCVAIQSSHIRRKKVAQMLRSSVKSGPKGSGCIGCEELLLLLERYTASFKKKGNINVGVFGYPNMGKNTLISNLKIYSRVKGGSCVNLQSGPLIVAKKVASRVRLIDCPGELYPNIVFDKPYSLASTFKPKHNPNFLALNCVHLKQCTIPDWKISSLIVRCVPPRQLITLYCVSTYKNLDELLEQIAQKRGIHYYFRNEYSTNKAKASHIIFRDWDQGHIPFYKSPPTNLESETTVTVSKFVLEFDVDQILEEMNKKIVEQLPETKVLGGYVVLENVPSKTKETGIDQNNDNDDDLSSTMDIIGIEDNLPKTKEVPSSSTFANSTRKKVNNNNKKKRQEKDIFDNDSYKTKETSNNVGKKVNKKKKGKKHIIDMENANRVGKETRNKKKGNKKQEQDESLTSDSDYDFSQW